MVMVVLIWGTNFSVTKAVLDSLPPLIFTALRFALASVVLLVLLRVLEPKRSISKSTWLKLIVIGIIGNTLYQPAFILGLHNTTATNSAVVIGSLPGVVALLAWLFRIEKLSPVVSVGIGLSLAGVFMVVGAGGISIGGENTLGDLLTLLAVFCWAAYTLGLRRIDPELSPLRITTITTVAGTPALIALGVGEGAALDWGSIPAASYIAVMYASLFSLVAAYFLYNTGVKRLGASRASVYSCFIPLVGVVVAWLFLDERPLPLQAVGAVVVMVGVWLTRKR